MDFKIFCGRKIWGEGGKKGGREGKDERVVVIPHFISIFIVSSPVAIEYSYKGKVYRFICLCQIAMYQKGVDISTCVDSRSVPKQYLYSCNQSHTGIPPKLGYNVVARSVYIVCRCTKRGGYKMCWPFYHIMCICWSIFIYWIRY